MLKKVSILSLVTSILFSCSIDNPFSNDTKSSKSSINSSFGDLDITKKVEIKILNPTNKSTAEWYKKDDKTVIMKIGSQSDIQGTATLKDETKSSNVTWSSSDNTIAVVNNGKITANKLGITTILATSNLDSSYKGILNVEVVDEANFASSDSKSINSVKSILAYVDISNKKYSSLSIGINQSISASASVILSDDQKNGNVIWESSDENIAIVDQDGKITAKKKGEITIVAKYKLNPDSKALINLEVSENTVDLKNMGKITINEIISNKIEKNIPETTNFNIKKVLFEENFENGLDNWISEFIYTKCGNSDFGAWEWNSKIHFRVISKNEGKYIVASNPENIIPVDSIVPFNVIKTKEPIDFSSTKNPRLQLQLKNTSIPLNAVNFHIFISSTPYIKFTPSRWGNCKNYSFDDSPESIGNLKEQKIQDLGFEVVTPFSLDNKDWTKKDFDLSGIKNKAGFIVISVGINKNIIKFEGPMIDSIKLYDAE